MNIPARGMTPKEQLYETNSPQCQLQLHDAPAHRE